MFLRSAALAVLVSTLAAQSTRAEQPTLIAISSISGLYEDFATETAGLLENGVPGNRLGGLGSGLTWMGGDLFLALPDRGANAVPFIPCTDDPVPYPNPSPPLHTTLAPADPASPLPYVLTPMFVGTTLLHSRSPLVYGAGCGSVGPGAPALNRVN